MEKEKNIFSVLSAINVNDKTEEKEGSTFLPWADAWGELMNIYPDATFTVKEFPLMTNEKRVTPDGEIIETIVPVANVTVPYLVTTEGILVKTEMTINGSTRAMHLPVMGSGNRALKTVPYKVMTKKGEINVPPATMTDINRAIFRCLVKNIAIFGLALYIYADEELPEPEKKAKEEAEAKAKAEAEAKAKAAAEAKIKEEAEKSGYKTATEARDAYAKLVDQPAEAVDAACKKYIDGKSETEIIAYFAGLIKKTEAKRKSA